MLSYYLLLQCLISGNTMDYGPFGFLDVYVRIATAATAFLLLTHAPVYLTLMS